MDYNGPRTANGIVNFMMDKMKSQALLNLNGKKKSSSSGSKSGSGSGGVIDLTDSNFSMVKNTDKALYMVMFMAPWCGHCKNLKPKWAQAARQNSNEYIKFAMIDCDTHKSSCSNYGIQGYPTIKVFLPGGKVEDYGGARETSALLEFADNLATNLKPVKPLAFLSDQAKYDEYCVEESGVCLISFLPHIADTGVEGRKKYNDLLKELQRKHKSKPLVFLWAQAGDQFGFEEKLNLGFGYPAVVALNLRKKKFGVMRDSFDEKGIDRFVTGLMSGRMALYDVVGDLPKIKKAQLNKVETEL